MSLLTGMAQADGRPATAPRYCYICAAARSGSTLLDLLLGGHPAVASLGEFSFINKALALGEACSCARPVTGCPAWAPLLTAVRQERDLNWLAQPYGLSQWDTWAQVDRDASRQTPLYMAGRKCRSLLCDLHFDPRLPQGLRPALPGRLREGARNTLWLYDRVRESRGRALVVDSSKNVHKALALGELAGARLKVLYLVRDGRGVYCSRRRSRLSRRLSWTGWARFNARALRLLPRALPPGSLMQLHYEDLVNAPEACLRRVCAFLELDFQPGMLDLAAGERHGINGNDTRFQRHRGIQPDTRWRQELPAWELAYFQSRCGALNRALGYE